MYVRGPVLVCEIGAVCSAGKYFVTVSLHMSLTLQSALALDMKAQPDGSIAIAGTTTGIPEARTELATIAPKTDGVTVALVEGSLILNPPTDFALARIASR